MEQIGLRAHDFGKNATPEKLAEILSGYRPVSIQLALEKALSNAPKPGQLSPGYARFIRTLLERHNIDIAVLGCYINPVHPNQDIREAQLKKFEEYLRYAHDFGCSIVGTETGSCNGDCSFHPDTEKDETFDLLCASLERLIKTAEKCGSIIGIEAVANLHTISTIEKMQKVLRRLDSPALKVIYDPVNLIPWTGLAENQSDFFEHAFKAFGQHIVAIYLKDFRMDSNIKNGSLSAGTGELDYPALFRNILKHKPGIDLLLENSNPASAREAMAYVQNIAAGISGVWHHVR